MAHVLTDDAAYVAETYHQVGAAIVWDVIRVTATESHDRIVGRIVLRDDRMYYRDNTACGTPLVLPARYGTSLRTMLRYAARTLFA